MQDGRVMLTPTVTPSLDRRGPLRVLGVMLALLIVAFVADKTLLRLIARNQPPEVLQQLTHERLLVATRKLPDIARDGTAVVFGTSPMQWGFSPAIFDRTLAQGAVTMRTYNLGNFGIGPDLMSIMARRLGGELEGQNRRLRLAVLEFTPWNATAARRNDFFINAMASAQRARLVNAPALLGIARHSLDQASEVLTLKAWGDLPPEAAVIIYNRMVLQPITNLGTDRRSRLIRDAGKRARVNSQGEAWNFRRRGEVVLRDPAKPQDYDAWLELHQQPAFMVEDLAWRVNSADIHGLHFDDDFIDDYIELARILETYADLVVVVVAPCHPDARPEDAAARARLAAVLKRIETEAHVPVVDLYESPAFVRYDFMDNTHVNDSTGKEKLSRILAERILPLLGDLHATREP